MKKYAVLPFLILLMLMSGPRLFAGVVLLHDGHIIQGEVSEVERIYHVDTGTGRIRLSADRVERVFDKIEDVYHWKRTLIRVGNHSEHVELARWCLKYNLLDLAQRELVAAELAEPGTPMVEYLQRRLTANRKAETAGVSEAPGPFTPLPTVKPFPETVVTPNFEAMVPAETLDQMTESISLGSLAVFSSTVQPILLNNCATGGCHVGAGPEKMRLSRSGLSGKAGRRTTQRNLHAVMEWVDLNRPDYSPLLTVPLRPHGKDSEVMVQGHREEYQQLVRWVMQVSSEQAAKKAVGYPGIDRAVRPAMHTEPVSSDETSQSGQSIVHETLELIPPEDANLQKKGKDGRTEPVYPSNNVSSTSPFRKALAVNPGLLKAFIEEAEDRGQKAEDR